MELSGESNLYNIHDMQILMSPAKLLDFGEKGDIKIATKPFFGDKTLELIEVCQKLSVDDIMKIMKVNLNIANETYGWFQSFNFHAAPVRAAALAYNGIAYKGLNAHDFDEADINYAQQNLNIISGLWGALRPFDSIKPYRLEMVRKIQPDGYKSLYEFWNIELNNYLFNRLLEDESVIINLASKEYSKVIDKALLPNDTKIIDVVFLQQRGGDLKQIVVHSKKARGMMSRFIIKNKLVVAEEAKAFDYEGYFFYPQLSEENKWVFVR